MPEDASLLGLRRVNRRQLISLASSATALVHGQTTAPKAMGNNLYSFHGGASGEWKVTSLRAVAGESLVKVERLSVQNGSESGPSDARWVLRGLTSNLRYATQREVASLRARQEGLGRPQASVAALIPIKKAARWWELAQDERRKIFEETSHHTAIGLDYLPAIARRLHHSRDLGEPFDFLTWFEFSPDDMAAFDELLTRLRKTPEWQYVEREVEVRLERVNGKR